MGIYRITNMALDMVNRTRSTRFNSDRKNTAIQVAVQDFINDRYDAFKRKKMAGHHFEGLQRIKDELNELVIINDTLTFVNDKVTLPVNYAHELAFDIKINGIWKPSDAANFDEVQELSTNSHTRPSADQPYHKRYGRTIEFMYGGVGTVSQVRLTYLKKHPIPFLKDDASQLIVAGPSVLTIGKQYVVVTTSASVVHNTITYNAGDAFVATSTILTGGGSVALAQEVELPEITEIELARRMATELSGSVENYSKMQVKGAEADTK